MAPSRGHVLTVERMRNSTSLGITCNLLDLNIKLLEFIWGGDITPNSYIWKTKARIYTNEKTNYSSMK
jgi:hypothetical protein